MEKIRIIGLDLDGTLLDEKKQITPRTRWALEKAAERGVVLVPVTGRPWTGIPQAVLELPGVRYLITSNGATIRDAKTGEHLLEHHIPHGLGLKVLSILKGYQVPHLLFFNGIGYGEEAVYRALFVKNRASPLLPYLLKTRRSVPGSLGDFFRQGEKSAEEFMVMAPSEERRDQVLAELQTFHGLSFAIPFPMDLEITAQGADKGEALLQLAQKLGLTPGSVMALGDSGNDLSLLRRAALPVAMGNATDEIKAASAFVTASNEEDGVALALEKFVLQDDE